MRLVLILTSLLFSFSALAFEQIPTDYEVLTDPAGPVVSAHLDAVHIGQVNVTECTSFAVYNGDTTLKFGNQTYKLIAIDSTTQTICPTDTDFKKFTQVIFIFQNTVYQNQIRFVLDQDSMPLISVVLDQSHVVPGRAL